MTHYGFNKNAPVLKASEIGSLSDGVVERREARKKVVESYYKRLGEAHQRLNRKQST